MAWFADNPELRENPWFIGAPCGSNSYGEVIKRGLILGAENGFLSKGSPSRFSVKPRVLFVGNENAQVLGQAARDFVTKECGAAITIDVLASKDVSLAELAIAAKMPGRLGYAEYIIPVVSETNPRMGHLCTDDVNGAVFEHVTRMVNLLVEKWPASVVLFTALMPMQEEFLKAENPRCEYFK